MSTEPMDTSTPMHAVVTTADRSDDAIGWWDEAGSPPEFGQMAMQAALDRIGRAVQLVDANGEIGVVHGGLSTLGATPRTGRAGWPLVGYAPALPPERLGDPDFRAAHRLRYAHVAGA